ncbi:MAG: adenylate/guanylate cyclase domain-containing protein [Firmicutes bacterium]|nr:adenylate/guanylate cyclase domain-containing protein [Bacillota bacterium]
MHGRGKGLLHSWRERLWSLRFWPAVLALLIYGLAAVLGWVAAWERSWQDQLYIWRDWLGAGEGVPVQPPEPGRGRDGPAGTAGSRVVLVAIDDESLARVGAWPWSRAVLGQLAESLARHGTVISAYDFILSEPAAKAGEDQRLARSLAKAGQAVLGSEADTAILRPTGPRAWLGEGPRLVVKGVRPPLPVLADQALAVGQLNLVPDGDGRIRRIYHPAGEPDLGWPPAFSWAAAASAAARLGKPLPPAIPVELLNFRRMVDWRPLGWAGMESGQDEGGAHAAYGAGVAPLGVVMVPAWRLLRPQVGWVEAALSETLRGSVAVVGITAWGLSGVDGHLTGYRALGTVPGAYIQATAVANWLQGDGLRAWPDGPYAGLIYLALLAGAAFLLNAFLNWRPLTDPLRGLVFTGTTQLLAAAGLVHAFVAQRLVLAPGAGLFLLLGLVYLSVQGRGLTARERQRRQLVRILRRYLSEPLAEELASHPEQVALGGQRALVAVLFADLAGFTAYSRGRAPEQVVAMLNEYLAAMAHPILARQGFLDKFTGDGVMAVFGMAPEHRRDPAATARAAVGAAVALLQEVAKVNERRARRGLPALEVRVGVHMGEAVLGHVGSEERLEYTAVGQTVNIAARLQAAAAPGEVLISQVLRDAAQPFPWGCSELRQVQAQGLPEPVPCFGLLPEEKKRRV